LNNASPPGNIEPVSGEEKCPAASDTIDEAGIRLTGIEKRAADRLIDETAERLAGAFRGDPEAGDSADPGR